MSEKKEAKRQVCLLCQKWKSGGIEGYLAYHLLHMDRTDTAFTLVAECIEESVFTAPLREAGVEFVELSGDSRAYFKNIRLFQRLLRKRHFDAVHLNCYQSLSLVYLRLAKQAGVPVRIAHSHNSDLRLSLSRKLKLSLHDWGKRFFADAPTLRLACSSPAADFMFERDAKWTLAPNAVDIDRFAFSEKARKEVRERLGIEDAFTLGCVGRLCYQKNQSFAIEILKSLRSVRRNAVLLLLGAGEDEAMLRRRARDEGMEDAMILLPPTPQVENYYCAMDVLLFPSRYEGLGIVAVEAQCSGLPVLASDRVPGEAAVGGDIRFLPLESGTEKWCGELLSLPLRSRKNVSIDPRYDIQKAAAKLKSIYGSGKANR